MEPEVLHLKIALVGNIANNFFREALMLRRSGSIDVTLFVEKNPHTHPTALPETENQNYNNGYPDWIKQYPSLDSRDRTLIRGNRLDLLKDSTRKLVNELNSYEIVVMSADGLLFAPAITSKTVFRPTGGDLTVLPFFWRSIVNLILYYPQWWRLLKPRPIASVYLQSINYRKAIKSVNFIAVSKKTPYVLTLEKLGIEQSKLLPGIDLAIDVEKFQSSTATWQDISPSLQSQLQTNPDNKFIVLLAGRYMAKASRVSRSVGDWKASDLALFGFCDFLESVPESSRHLVELWLPDSEMSPQISDAKKLVQKLRIEKNVRFIRGEDPAALARPEMIELYSLATVCLDDFGAGWFGSVVVEALSCSCPVITWVSQEFMEEYYEWHPILLAQTAGEIKEQLLKIYQLNKEEYKSLSTRSRLWASEYFTEDNTLKRYREAIKRVIGS
jgi:glycosyltransferase involved in cell wall biosynthesis